MLIAPARVARACVHGAVVPWYRGISGRANELSNVQQASDVGMQAQREQTYVPCKDPTQPQQQSTSHYSITGFFLGADVNLHTAAEKLSGRVLSLARDYSVYTLGPPSSVVVGPERKSALNVSLMLSPQTANGATTTTAPDGSGVLRTQLQLVTTPQGRTAAAAAAAAAPGGSPRPAQPKRLTMSMVTQLRADLITQGHLLEHVSAHGVMIVFKFGSVVFFEPRGGGSGGGGGSGSGSGGSDSSRASGSGSSGSGGSSGGSSKDVEEVKQELKRAVRAASTDQEPANPRKEEASVVVRPSMRRLYAKETDRLAISELDLGNLEVICRVIGQSAALDHYTSKVDESLRDFDVILRDLADNAGKPFIRRPMMFSRLRGGRLLAMIAASSLMYNKVVAKLGLLDTSRTAWESDDHDFVWKAVMNEFELKQRFANLVSKLDVFKEESRFILEVRNERGTANAERIIIALIALEIGVNLVLHLSHSS
ncbi:hypothetical protein FOA52_014498 [Chlamydomonas sp. UWO 241]|nr:hypothetical protein FOA52_014498 [Chlamydomonas sp. UWO 241]